MGSEDLVVADYQVVRDEIAWISLKFVNPKGEFRFFLRRGVGLPWQIAKEDRRKLRRE